ncbi:Mfa1 family fimbria major subunit [Prevotella merdae]|uniref:Mfa1 family fimbria major subunit n=1 Tax=Prevotella merdae TaxID=2079531 RepID=UPI000D0E47B2|nr:Mfa1 family fimbria major subunit [Prevotella merdae]
MKFFKFFPLACAALMMSACSSDDPSNGGEKPNIASEAQYLAVNIVNVGTTPTRALTGDYQDGSTEESTINKIRFYFFHNDGSPYILNGTIPDINWLENSSITNSGKDTPNGIEQITNSILVINGTVKTAPAKMVAIINPETLTELDNTKKTLAQLTGSLVDTKFYNTTGTTPNDFVMSNSVYATSEGLKVCENKISGFVYSDATNATAHPVDIYVERVAAKVKASLTGAEFQDGASSTWGAGKKGIKVGSYSTYDIYAIVDGWGVADENGKANLEKQIQTSWSDTGLGFSTWTTADYHRSFWETSVPFSATNNIVNHKFTDYSKQPDEFLYTLPNTSATAIPAPATPVNPSDPTIYKNDRTKFLLTAHLMYKDGTSWKNAELCTYKGIDYLGVDVLKNQIAFESGYYVKTSAGSSTYQRITKDDITFVKPTGKADYLVVPALVDDAKTYYINTGTEATPTWEPVTGADANTALANETAQVRTNGMAYYYIPIKHLGTDNTVGEYGIVRNHIYDVKVNSLKGFGTPVYDEGKTIIPTMPDDSNTYLAARINVLQWRVVSQKVDLGK